MEQGTSKDRERELEFSTAWAYALRGESEGFHTRKVQRF
jgi:hypothetical protein